MPELVCFNCRTLFKADRKSRRYCSHSCAAIINNRLFPKRPLAKKYYCSCGKKKSKRAKICLKCVQEKRAKRTLRDVFQDGRAGVDKWSRVREDARDRMKRWGVEKKCKTCGWDKHVHAIHVKPIASFTLDTLLDIVNKRSNLRYLCPNCHWIFDSKK